MEILNETLGNIAKEFEIKSTPLTKFVGIKIKQDKKTGVISLLQSTSILDLLKKFNMDECKSTTVPMQPNLDLILAEKCDDALPFRELIESLLFIGRTACPYISYAAANLT
jgi:hypothetical protein